VQRLVHSLNDQEPVFATAEPAHHGLNCRLALILLAARQSFPTLMVGPPSVFDEDHNRRITRLSEQLALLCETVRVPSLEVFAPLQQINIWQEELTAHDGAHPRAAGSTALARLIEDWFLWREWLT